MQRIPVPYPATGRFSALVNDYLSGDASLREHYVHAPDLNGLRAAAEQRRFAPASRAALVATLRQQYQGVELHEAVQANLAALEADSTLTVTTGHQLCLFTGPLYVPFKLLNAIRLANTLTAQLGRKVVPVFWMATEDHDRDEIDHAWLGDQKVQWPGSAGGPVGRMPLTGIKAVIDEAVAVLGEGEGAREVEQLLRSCYTVERSLSEATRLFVNALFGRFGLIILDADVPALKRLFAPVLQEEVLNQVTQRTVSYADAKLAERYAPQAHAREINVFHLALGQRSRIVLEDGRYRSVDGKVSWSVDELLVDIQVRPQDFSPNVMLRPVYQELVLPNIAYIGGGGELAYWMQLRWLFQGLQVPMPVVLLRTSAAFIPAKQLRQWQELGLSVPELFAPLDALKSRVAVGAATFATDVEQERRQLNAMYDALLLKAAQADTTLRGAVEARRTKALHGLEHIEQRLVRAAKRQQTTLLERMDRVHEAVFPGGGLQERKQNMLPFLAAYGPGILDTWLNELDPLDPQFSVLVED